MKKIISILLLAAMLLSSLASCAGEKGILNLGDYPNDTSSEVTAYTDAAAWDGSATDSNWKGTAAGTAEDPYPIKDGADLKGFITDVANGTDFTDKVVKLTNNINLGNKAWSIPESSNYFKGTFDGNGKTIGGFKITCTTGNQSLLGAIGGNAEVKNLIVQNGTVSMTASAETTYVAIVVSKIVTESGKTAKITNVDMTTIEINGSNIKCSYSQANTSKKVTAIGGIVGGVTGNGSVSITGCASNATLSKGSDTTANDVGGIVGQILTTGATGTITISDCTVTGNVTGTSNVGGIIGHISTSAKTVAISACITNSTINGKQVIGGIAALIEGVSSEVSITNCENKNTVIFNKTGSSQGHAGGIVGCCQGDRVKYTITNCNNSGSITYTGTPGYVSMTTAGYWMGGIVGYIKGYYNSSTNYHLGAIKIDNCHNTGKIQANRTSAGLIGFIQRVSTVEIVDSSVSGDTIFTMNSTSNYILGGFVGVLETSTTGATATISRCTVAGSVTFEDPKAQTYVFGCMLGELRKAALTVSDCEISIRIKNTTDGDTYNVVLGNKNSGTITVTGLTYIPHSIDPKLPALDSGINLKEISYFKPIGQQYDINPDGSYNVRFVFGIGNIQAVDAGIGFDVSMKKLGLDVTVRNATRYCSTVYKSIHGTTANGVVTYNASDYACDYLYTLTIAKIPASEIEIQQNGNYSNAYVKNTIIDIVPFSQANATAEKHVGKGIEGYTIDPQKHTFRFEDFSMTRPDAFGTGNGIMANKNINSTFANLPATSVKTTGNANQYVLSATCECTGNHCTCDWNAKAIAFKPYGPLYHYYIDESTYNGKFPNDSLTDRYEAYHTWSFEVKEDGLYEFCFRIRLSDGDNQSRYALVQFDGEDYSQQTEFSYTVNISKDLNNYIRDAATQTSYIRGYKRYLEKGTHTVTFRLPYDVHMENKSLSMHIRDIYFMKAVADPVDAGIPMPEGATIYDGNFDSAITYVLDNTTLATLNTYIASLKSTGFEQKDFWETKYKFNDFTDEYTGDFDNFDSSKPNYEYTNTFYLLTNNHYMVYAYYTEGAKAMRVIVDYISEYDKYVEKKKTEDAPVYTDVTDPLFAILDIGGKDITLTSGTNKGSTVTGVTNGMCLVFRLSDGRFIIVDGGFWNTKDTEGECVKRLYDWLQKNDHINGENNKIVIANWIITHHHSDHIAVAHKFDQMKKAGTFNVEVQNYMYNFPSYEYARSIYGSNLSVPDYRDYYPQLHHVMQTNNNLVVHTGMSYQFADCSIEILYTHEDFYPEKITSYNNSSTVYKITLAGKSFLVAGDLEEPGQKRAIKQAGTLLQSDFLQVTHHGSNAQIEFYKYIVGFKTGTTTFNTDTIVIWPLPKAKAGDSMFDETSKTNEAANKWLRDTALLEIHYAVDNWVFTDFNQAS